MKKLICFFAILITGMSLYAFDRSLNGSWGIFRESEKIILIRFNTNEITVMDSLFRPGAFSEADDTFYIDDFDGDSVIIQYFRLSPNKLLFIMWNTDNPEQSITLILSKM